MATAGGAATAKEAKERGGWMTTLAIPKPAGGSIGLSCDAAINVTGATSDKGPYAELQARHDAIERWRQQVSDRLGYEFAQWWRAREKDVACREVAGAMQCEATATPCKSESASSGEPAVRSGLGVIGRTR